MTANEILKIHEQIIESWNRHDPKKFISFLDENIVLYETSIPKPIKGRVQAEQYFNTWVSAFPDLKMKTVNTVISGDYIAAELECTGTNKGPIKLGDQPEIPATNRQATTRMCFFAKVKDGKTLEVRTYPDIAGMMIQLGLHELAEAHA
jgi:predicted ester cyclase